jgi:hypothetical protein
MKNGLALTCILVVFPFIAFAQNNRSFVATFGNDANSCALGTECRSISKALTVTNAGGEIIAVNSGGYGTFVITKSVVVVAPLGVDAAITGTAVSAVDVNAAGAAVVLRGLDLNSQGGQYGILGEDFATLSIENCTFDGFTSNGILILASAGVKTYIRDSIVRNSGNVGIGISDGLAVIERSASIGNYVGVFAVGSDVHVTAIGCVAALNAAEGFTSRGSASLDLENCVSASNGTHGASTYTSGILRVSNCTITENSGDGLHNNSGTIESRQNNSVRGNGAVSSGAITPITGV